VVRVIWQKAASPPDMDCIPCTLKWPDLSPQPKGHLCWFSHFLQGSWSWQTDQQMNKPVGFHGPIAPPVLNANSSECPQFGMPAEIRSLHAGAARRLLLHAAARWCCTPLPASAYHSIGGGLPEWQISKSIFSVSFVRIESIFYNTQETQTQKKWWTRILKFEFCDF